ncbi:M10 family metallopeptidase C-terminal domain-containing protein [Sphingomonas crusticola]|uniref:M10 family metallopeptidase C-terminal domain-containing protein n=1 Tax=Sphingomonas crusticola TaxID=1697973 RepID=UPI0023DDC355|nr:M10 family metallopeptidase C-terminal domain-containing protein [Sphingomonas crusticola]
MSNTDSLSFAPDSLVRGGLQSNGKTSLSPAAAADHIAAYPWQGSATITYAFRISGTVPDDDSKGFSQFNAREIAGAEKALQAWADVANVHFTRVNDGAGYSDNATILFGNFDDGPGAGFTYLPGSRAAGSVDGDVWINSSEDYNTDPVIGDYGGQVFVHEIGHAIGLTHPGNYDATDDQDPTYADDAEYYEDSRQYTVMSYFPSTNTGAFLGAFSGAPLLDDISAIQYLYGANMTTRTGDTVYGFHSTAGREYYSLTNANSVPLFAVWDAGGNDTLDFSGYSDTQRIDLRAGNFSDVGGYAHNVSIAYNVTIENAIGGSGVDTIIGNNVANILDGGSGNDLLYGEAGNDTLRGGAGDDRLDGGSGVNLIDGGLGNDTLMLPGLISDYHSALVSGGYWISGNGITDTISNIETIVTRAVGATGDNGSYSLAAFVAQTPGAVQSAGSANDFNGDGRSDIVWHHVSGAVSTWQFGGTTHGDQIQQSVYNGSADPSWNIIETGDFDGNGSADFLWRNTNGTIAIWNATGNGSFVGGYVDASVGNGWKVAAVGDINGDGKADLLWRYDDGSISSWSSNGNGFAQNSYFHASVGTSWKVEGLADFNGDGRADIMWRNDNGSISTWLSTGNGFAENSYSDSSVGTSWHIAALADFNGDGKADILWRNDNGSISTWNSNGNGFSQNSYSDSSVGNYWHIAEVADFNHDGKADILWRNDSGGISTWESNSNGFTQSVANSWAPTDWTIVAHHFPL